jgi:hypothetical protein
VPLDLLTYWRALLGDKSLSLIQAPSPTL